MNAPSQIKLKADRYQLTALKSGARITDAPSKFQGEWRPERRLASSG
jgi:hypothetical protein